MPQRPVCGVLQNSARAPSSTPQCRGDVVSQFGRQTREFTEDGPAESPANWAFAPASCRVLGDSPELGAGGAHVTRIVGERGHGRVHRRGLGREEGT